MKEGDLVTMPMMPMRTRECPDNLGLVIGWDEAGDPWIWMSPSVEYKEDLLIVSEA